MPRFNIYDPASAIDRGTFEAETSTGALDAMAKAAGYRDAAHMREATGADPGLIVSLVGLDDSPEPAAFIARREAANLSQSKAAAMIGVSLRTLQYWEARKYKIPADMLDRLIDRTERLVKS